MPKRFVGNAARLLKCNSIDTRDDARASAKPGASALMELLDRISVASDGEPTPKNQVASTVVSWFTLRERELRLGRLPNTPVDNISVVRPRSLSVLWCRGGVVCTS